MAITVAWVVVAAGFAAGAGAGLRLAPASADCGLMAVDGFSASSSQVWARGVSCSSARSLLGSPALSRGLPTAAFVSPRVFKLNGFTCAYDGVQIICWAGPSDRKAIAHYQQTAARARSVFLAWPVRAFVSGPTPLAAAIMITTADAAREGKSSGRWTGHCDSGIDPLVGKRLSTCYVGATERDNSCVDLVGLYRSAPVRPYQGATGRYEVLGDKSLFSC